MLHIKFFTELSVFPKLNHSTTTNPARQSHFAFSWNLGLIILPDACDAGHTQPLLHELHQVLHLLL